MREDRKVAQDIFPQTVTNPINPSSHFYYLFPSSSGTRPRSSCQQRGTVQVAETESNCGACGSRQNLYAPLYDPAQMRSGHRMLWLRQSNVRDEAAGADRLVFYRLDSGKRFGDVRETHVWESHGMRVCRSRDRTAEQSSGFGTKSIVELWLPRELFE